MCSPAQVTCQALLSSGCHPAPSLPRGRAQASEAAPCKMAAAGGGRAGPEKASIYKAPSSLLHSGGGGLGAGSHSSMGEPVGLPTPRRKEATGTKLPHTPGSAGLARSGARAPK